jgi:hypothetical protein
MKLLTDIGFWWIHRVPALYRGILPPIMVEAPKRATKFATNEQYSAVYKRMFGVDKMTQPLAILTGISAGITEAFLIVPFELVKIRMQDKANVSIFDLSHIFRFCYSANSTTDGSDLVILLARKIQRYNGYYYKGHKE